MRNVETGEESRVVKVKRFAIEPMFEEDAISRMEELGHTFFIFVNAENERVAVLYRRRDGRLGLIEPVIAGSLPPVRMTRAPVGAAGSAGPGAIGAPYEWTIPPAHPGTDDEPCRRTVAAPGHGPGCSDDLVGEP